MISLAITSCKDSAVVHSYNVKGQYFNRFNTHLDKKSCKIIVEDLEPIDSDDRSLDGLVCVTKAAYSTMKAEVKTECENDKVK